MLQPLRLQQRVVLLAVLAEHLLHRLGLRLEDLEQLLQNDLGPRVFLTSGPERAVDPRLELGRFLLLVLLLELLGSELLLLHLEVGVELAVVGVVA